MSVEPARRQALGAALRARRERLKPHEVDLAAGPRRRTPGLRREEVAILAGVSTTYYTYLEQGRDVRPSAQVLEALARALRMTPAERTQLFELAHGTPPPHGAAPAEDVHPSTRALLDALDPSPAYLVGWRWDVLAMNEAAKLLYGGDFSSHAGLERNTAWWMLTDPDAARLLGMDEAKSRRMLARLRARTARYQREPAMLELCEALRAAHPRFEEWWARQEVLPQDPLTMRFDHPQLGEFELGHVAMDLAHDQDQRIVALPLPPGSAIEARFRALVAERRSRGATRRRRLAAAT